MKKVLVVDNDRLLLEFMKDVLSEKGMEVLTAEDGLMALDILRTFRPDFIFVDLIMPNIDGRKLCRLIRAMDEIDSHLIVLSAVVSEDEDGITGLDADACIAKGPFDFMAGQVMSIINDPEIIDYKTNACKLFNSDNIHPREITKELLFIKRHFEIVLENMSDGIIEINENRRVIYANNVAVSLFGLPEVRLLGAEFSRLFSGDDRDRAVRFLDKAKSHPVSLSDDETMKLNGFLVLLDIIPVKNNGPNSIIIVRDVTKRKTAEKALRENEQKYRIMSITDGLTGLHNSRYFSHQLKAEVDRAARYGHPLSLLLMDLDDFKSYNDRYGHVKGDDALTRVAQITRESLRHSDSAYRYGGEEFTVILPETGVKDAALVAERIRKGIESEEFDIKEGEKATLTASVGVGQYRRKENFMDLLKRIDKHMYEAKRQGKNMVYFEQ